MAVSPQAFEVTKAVLKEHYAPFSKDLIREDNKFLKMMTEVRGFKKEFGGRKLVWSLQVNRAHNTGARTEQGFFPGFSGITNDDLDPVSAITAEVNRGYAFGGHAMTGQDIAEVHDEYDMGLGLHGGWKKLFKMAQGDFNTFLNKMFLGDQTGVLGVVVSAVFGGGVTTITLQPASTLSARGIHGTQRLQANQKIGIVRAADFATSARTARVVSNINGLGLEVLKVLTATGPHDVGASPQITVAGDLTGGAGAGALAAGDVIVDALSRPSAAAGGNAADDSGLTHFKGLYNYVDNGLLDTTVFGQLRSAFPMLNSIVDNNLAGRMITAPLIQSIVTKLSRRLGNDEEEVGLSDLILFTEKSVKDGYVANESEASKRYQGGDLQKLLPGWYDVGWQFLGSDRAMAWATDHMIPYGHALFIKKSAAKVFWDVPPSLVNSDGLELRQISGKDVFYFMLRAYGNFVVDEPWLCARGTGFLGAF